MFLECMKELLKIPGDPNASTGLDVKESEVASLLPCPEARLFTSPHKLNVFVARARILLFSGAGGWGPV